jgi:L-lactate dehydrogenase (cytochrome)
VDGVIVSNHGGRQLDGAISPIAVLPAMLPVHPQRALMCDGGIRRGNDVLKALGRGAQMAWVGRPMLQAAVVGGESGVRYAIGMLRDEMLRSMAMLGLTRPHDAAQVLWSSDGPVSLA